MCSRLFVGHVVNIKNTYVNFLQYIHPHFEIVSNLDGYDRPDSNGIIYTGNYNDGIKEYLSRITPSWIIVNAHHYDIDLTTNEGLYKSTLPLHFFHDTKKSKKEEVPAYKKVVYDELIDYIKLSLICNTPLNIDDTTSRSLYSLFVAILGVPDMLSLTYFKMLDDVSINVIISSVLTFLTRVNEQQYLGVSTAYARLISQSHQRYGKRIKGGILRYIKSKAKPEISLYQLLLYLNGAK